MLYSPVSAVNAMSKVLNIKHFVTRHKASKYLFISAPVDWLVYFAKFLLLV